LRKNLFAQTFRHPDAREAPAQSALNRLLFFVPGLELGICSREAQGFCHVGLGRLVQPGAIQQQDFFGLFRGHELPFPSLPGPSSASAFCNWAIPRAMRDFTVPIGMSRTSAISL